MFRYVEGKSGQLKLLANSAYWWLAGAFHRWFPDIHKTYQETIDEICKRDPSLQRPSAHSVFAGSTVNLGPQTVCDPHRDFLNFIFGLCLVVAFGDFDSEKGGHLILHEPKLIIRLRPGDMILFPSGCITHSNMPIQPHETRGSLTSYTAGGLFRYKAQGYRTRSAWAEEDPVGMKIHDALGDHRWKAGWSMYSTLDELKTRV